MKAIVAVIAACLGGVWAAAAHAHAHAHGNIPFGAPAMPPVLVDDSAAPACGDLSEDRSRAEASAAKATALRPITTHDLLALRDIETPSVSPDGDLVAVRVHQAHLPSNGYCTEWWVAPLDGTRPPVRVDSAGGPTLRMSDEGTAVGSWLSLAASWSPDGTAIAYPKLVDGRMELWRTTLRDRRAERLVRANGDVGEIVWSGNGDALIFSVGPSHAAMKAALRDEGNRGFLYDERMVPRSRAVPYVRRDAPPYGQVRVRTWDPNSGRERAATATERHRHALRFRPTLEGVPADASQITWSRNGRAAAWGKPDPEGPHGWTAPVRIHALPAGSSQPVRCSDAPCVGAYRSLFWSADARTLYLLRKENEAGDQIALYAWRPHSSEPPRAVLRTFDVLEECIEAGREIVCAHESALSPRSLVAIDIADGSLRTILDANPEFRELELPSVVRLDVSAAGAKRTYAHMIAPLHDDPSVPDPLVVTTYLSRGFQRGGIGDEYPILVMASKGLRVLNYTMPTLAAADRTPVRDINMMNFGDAALWRVSLDALEGVLGDLVDDGLVDGCRIGISGLSSGANLTHYALIHSTTFAAAAASSQSWEPMRYWFGLGPRQFLGGIGYLYPPSRSPDIWNKVSLARNVERITAPILWQYADTEYLRGLEAYTALRDAGKAVEMYVYPGEEHVKLWPRHRLAVYERNVDWFRFWLQGDESDDPDKAAQYERWRAMRALPSVGNEACGR